MIWNNVVSELFHDKADRKLKNELLAVKEHPKTPEHQYYYLWDKSRGDSREVGENAQAYFMASPLLSDSKQKVEATIELFTQSQEIVEGVYRCKNCQSRKTLSLTKQVRSADENTTNQIICSVCGNKWTE